MSNLAVPVLQVANNTKSGRKTAISLYDKFAPLNGFRLFEFITIEYLNSKVKENDKTWITVVLIFSTFATYLSTPIAQTASGYYAAASAKQIFSDFKNALDGHTSKMCMYLQPTGTDGWYEQLYHCLFRRCASAAIARGEQVSTSSDAIWRGILNDICHYLVCCADSYSNRYLWRVVFITLYSVIGRAGEAATATWDSMKWNTTLQCPAFLWSEVKTGKTCPVTIFCDASSWKMCWWHAMFCYLMTSDGGSYDNSKDSIPDGVEFLFPFLHNFTNGGTGVSSMVTKVLHALAKLNVIPGLEKSHTSHGFKAGSADDASLHIFCCILDVVARANWDYSGYVTNINDMYCMQFSDTKLSFMHFSNFFVLHLSRRQGMLFHYITHIKFVSRCGKALAGYKYPHKDVIAPTVLAFIKTDSDKLIFNVFAKVLFKNATIPGLHSTDRLLEMRNGLIAAFLKDLPDFKATAPANDPVLLHVFKCARDCDISVDTLFNWGAAVKRRWEAENGAVQIDDVVSEATVKAMSRSIVELSDFVVQLQRQLAQQQQNEERRLQNEKRMEDKLDNVTKL